MISEQMTRDGQWLFKHRGVLPALLLIPGLWELAHFRLLLGSHTIQQVWDWTCFAISFAGLALRATTVGCVVSGTSGRNTETQRAAELNITGWYSVVRNPLYLGNYLIMLGIILVPADISLFLVSTCLFWIYYERIISAEEEFLHVKFGATYADWARRTPVFFPRLSGWRSPARSFSWRMMLRREYSAVLLIGIAFVILNVAEHLIVEHRWYIDAAWALLSAACFFVYVLLRSLKKHTLLLRVD